MSEDAIIIDDWIVNDLEDFQRNMRWGAYVLHFERGEIVRCDKNINEKPPKLPKLRKEFEDWCKRKGMVKEI